LVSFVRSEYPIREKWVRDVAAYTERRRSAYPLGEKWVRDVAAYTEAPPLRIPTS